MALELVERSEGRVAEFKCSGALTREDYEHLVQEVERLTNQHGPIRVLIDLSDLVPGKTPVAWETLDFDLSSLGRIERVALLGEELDAEWQREFVRPFPQARVRNYSGGRYDAAHAWLREESEVSGEAGGKGGSGGAGEATFWSEWQPLCLVAFFLSALGLFGVALDSMMEANTWWYWLLVIAVFVVTAMRLEGGAKGEGFWPQLRQQGVYWAGFVGALILIQIFAATSEAGEMRRGLLTLMVLAVVCFYAGVGLHRLFFLVALVTSGVFVLAAFLKEYLWIALVLLAVGVGVLLVYQKWPTRRGRMQAGGDKGGTSGDSAETPA